LEQLEKLLFEQGSLGTKDDFIVAYGEQPLGRFIRSILGLDANAAKQAFGEILNGQTLNAQQIRLMDMIINFWSRRWNLDLLSMCSCLGLIAITSILV
jgi:type I restriction enzyme R subunit